jgi:hypothetical protein
VRGLTLAAVAALFAGDAAAEPLDHLGSGRHPGAYLALLVLLAVGAVAGLASLVALVGTVVPAVRGAADRHARLASPGWTTLAGALVAVGVLGLVAWASKVGGAAAPVAAIALGLPSALLFTAGLLGTLPLLGERLLGARGAGASPLLRHVVGAAVVLFALAAGAALQVPVFVGAIAVGWPLGTGLGATLVRLRRRPTAPPTA